MDNFSFLNAAHTAFFADLYDQYLKDPDSVEPSWRAFFQGYDFGSNKLFEGEIIEGVTSQIPDHVQKEFNVGLDTLGFVVSISALLFGLGAIPAGWLDRYLGGKKLMIIYQLGASVSALMIVLTSSFYL